MTGGQAETSGPGAQRGFGLELPDYPWDTLIPYRRIAEAHPDGAVDLSVGTPVDPTPAVVRQALADAADGHGYPTTHGGEALRQAIADWYSRRRAVPGLDPGAVLPTVGSKELIAWLPVLLGLGPGDIVVRPEIAYPTYDIGARLAGAQVVATDEPWELEPQIRNRIRLIWINSPGNPTGAVQDIPVLQQFVAEARALGAVLASDECYAELGWGAWDEARGGTQVPSLLHPRVAGGSHEGLLAVYSLSKQSNMAGYRAAFSAGDPRLIANLLNTRKHAGMMVPGPVQRAMSAALGDDAHVQEQKDLYRGRRERLRGALEAFGLRIEHSEAGLYLWGTAEEDAWRTIGRLAELGLIAGPGSFYGSAGDQFVRIALTCSDAGIDAAVHRLRGE
ncbi:succinyldiaminopimelate transaminase [Acaricomes phytoseiuli]|uniref:succinyldiaminopimelate transaminase n=1 Tax=Acaricomes phytoseiuli TaxID=291968 RepID=UPI00037A3D20|nr:succinyldiaminopimelate transaminase [Acaricomes phytoseiuli]